MISMKVGILTFYYNNDNFGGQLQARALVKALDSLEGIDAEQIQYDNLRSWQRLSYKTRLFKSIQQAFSGGIGNGISFLLSRIKAEKEINNSASLQDKIKKKLECRKKAFDEFCAETPHSKEIFDNDSISQCLQMYDCFVCGGDQIWNDWSDWFIYNVLDNYCLEFVPQTVQKFSYAPSVPLKKVRPIFIKKLTDNMKQLDAISVRERSSVMLLEEKCGEEVSVVIDPVLLLTREQWDKEMHATNIKEKYVFCYLLGEGLENRKAAELFATKIDCELVTVPNIINVNEQDCEFGDIQDYSSGPAEFLSLIKNAEVVVTDSFHAAVFCMIYHKPFYVLERTTQVSGGTMGSRLIDFLEEYNLTAQKIDVKDLVTICEIPLIDYTEADSVLEKRREDSYAYLKKNLKMK